MPEETWAVHGGTPACDLCHSRKVKCDRQDPCKSCVVSNVRCLRTRPKRTPQPRPRTDDKIKALVDKLASLEDVVRHATPLSQASNLAHTSSLTPRSTEDLSPRPLKHRRVDVAESIGTVSPCESATPHLQQSGAARDHIAKELSHNESLALHQRNVFETALAFIDQLSQAPSNVADDVPEYLTIPTDFTKGELVQLLLASQQKDNSQSDMQLLMLDHIPLKALERMTMMLLDATADERTLNMCKVVVHFKAALRLYANQLNDPKDAKTRKYIQGMQLHHLNAALTALSAVSFMTPPSLLLLQTLLTGAILMYIIGNSSTSWTLTAYASRTLIALNYHNTNIVHPPEQQQEINTAVAWCYHMDRLMSLLLLRHPSLPSLPVPVASLVNVDATANPMAIFALVMLQFVEVHEGILEMTLKGPGKREMERAEAEARVADLRARMDAIYRMIEEARTATTNTTTTLPIPSADHLLHWHSLQFKFYSTLTAVHRLSSVLNPLSSKERDECLYVARRALQCVKSIHDLSKQQDHFLEGYNPYLAWTLLSYPLTPFFVLFSNVVVTSNASDFLLLQDVVDSIASLVAENRYVEKLRRLCSKLLGLCRPLVQQLQQPMARDLEVGGKEKEAASGVGVVAASGLESTMLSMGGLGLVREAERFGEMAETEKTEELWDDEMMRQLLQCQPSLDWFNSDILDLEKWELDMPSSG